jgi:hypothetical protein
MSESNLCPQARQAALALYKSATPEAARLPSNLPPAYSEEAYELYGAHKPGYYALVARVIDQVVDSAITRPAPLSSPEAPTWTNLRKDMNNHFNTFLSTTLKAKNEPSLEAVRSAFKGRRKLRPSHQRTADQSLADGITTAAEMSVGILSDFAPVAKEHPDGTELLRNSYGRLIKMASVNSVQLIPFYELWRRQEMPKVVVNEAGQLIDYAMPPLDIEITGHLKLFLYSYLGGVVTAKSIRELGGQKVPTVGCPILFKPNQVQALWNWTIDQATERGLVA